MRSRPRTRRYYLWYRYALHIHIRKWILQKIIKRCIPDATFVGQHGTLGIIIRPYDPSNVICGSEPQSYEPTKCEALLNELPADTGPERTYGPRYQPGVDVPMPHEWRLACEYSSSVIQAT